MTASPTLAADFRAWGCRVDAYDPHHHTVAPLLAMQHAEGVDQARRESEFMDNWCADWVGREGFEAKVEVVLNERENLVVETEGRVVGYFGAAERWGWEE
jgi:hypothetical protein